jgi:hypothetical protein
VSADLPVIFPTLESAGYTSCAHPRVRVNTAGDLTKPLTECMDCGAQGGHNGWATGGYLNWPRAPLYVP